MGAQGAFVGFHRMSDGLTITLSPWSCGRAQTYPRDSSRLIYLVMSMFEMLTKFEKQSLCYIESSNIVQSSGLLN